MNLLEETKNILAMHDKSIIDIEWIGSHDFKVNKHKALYIFDKTDYDSGYGSQKVAKDLLVVGDHWWLERHEYDGSEWWEYKELPTAPDKELRINKVAGGLWDTLGEINEVQEDDSEI